LNGIDIIIAAAHTIAVANANRACGYADDYSSNYSYASSIQIHADVGLKLSRKAAHNI
jgi:hypothetical protein